MNSQQRAPHNTVRTRLAELDTVSLAVPAGGELGPERTEGGMAVAPVTVLEIRRGPDAGRRFALATDTVTLLGRHPGCDIMLSDVTVSRRHAEIGPTQHGFVLTNTGSLNGTYLNGTLVDTAPLAHGDEIQIGIFRLGVYAGEDSPPQHHPLATSSAHQSAVTIG